MNAAKLIPGLEERFADVKGVRMRYFIGGSGDPPVVLVHGLGGAAANWVELAPLLARRHRVLAPDLPGHAGSSPLPAAPNLDAYADRVALLAVREGVAPAAVVGHSLGALVTLRLALRRPGETAALVLAASAGFSPRSRRAEQALVISSLVQPGRLLAPYRELVARRPRLRRLVLSWGVADPEALSDRAVEGFLAAPATHTDTASATRALILDEVTGDLARIACPCLVLWGARDRQTPIADGFEYARRLRAPLRTIPDCGHLLIGERADACADAIEAFLTTVGEPPV